MTKHIHRPFPLEKVQTHEWPGVHKKDPTRPSPVLPEVGEDSNVFHKENFAGKARFTTTLKFAEGGLVPDVGAPALTGTDVSVGGFAPPGGNAGFGQIGGPGILPGDIPGGGRPPVDAPRPGKPPVVADPVDGTLPVEGASDDAPATGGGRFGRDRKPRGGSRRQKRLRRAARKASRFGTELTPGSAAPFESTVLSAAEERIKRQLSGPGRNKQAARNTGVRGDGSVAVNSRVQRFKDGGKVSPTDRLNQLSKEVGDVQHRTGKLLAKVSRRNQGRKNVSAKDRATDVDLGQKAAKNLIEGSILKNRAQKRIDNRNKPKK